MKVKVNSILEDSYMYLVIQEQSKEAIAVDPAVPHRVRGGLGILTVVIDSDNQITILLPTVLDGFKQVTHTLQLKAQVNQILIFL